MFFLVKAQLGDNLNEQIFFFKIKIKNTMF